MTEKSNFTIRLSRAAREFNMGKDAIVKFLAVKGFQIDSAPNTKLTAEMYELLVKAFQGEKDVKEEAKKLGNLSYKGGSVSIESTFENDKEKRENKEKNGANRTLSYQQPTSEGDEVEKEILVPLSKLNFGSNYISIKFGSLGFFLIESGISPLLNSEKSLNDISTNILLNYPNHTFKFLDSSLLSNLKEMSALLKKVKETEKLQKQIENFQKQIAKEKGNKERKGIVKTQIEHKVSLSTLKFGQGFVSITYKGKCYYYKDPKIRNYDKTIKQIFSRLSKARRNSLNAFFIEVIIDISAGTFTFKNIDICDYVNELKESSLPENNKTENRNRIRLNKAARIFNVSKDTIIEFLAKNGFIIVNPLPNTKLTEEMYELLVKEYLVEKDVPQKPSTTYEKMSLGTSNIRFFNGYYLIFQTTNGKVDNSVTPYRVNDPNSLEILNLVHGYFERKLEQLNIIVKIDKTAILEPSKIDQFQLSNYVRFLNQNLNEKGGWWEEVQNYRKPSLKQCRSVSAEVAKKKVSLKNGYLDSLVSMQSEIKLIPVYEVNLNHGKEEDAFIFTINMSNDRCAIIFENASKDASTTTWVFVAKMENYESCINLVFDYFTDYTLSSKRHTLRTKTVNPPEKFKAEDYTFIDHDNLGQWLKKLNKILEQTAEPSDITFVPGLHIPESSESRAGHGDTITTKHLHNQLMRRLYDRLCIEHGKDNVGTEIRTGTKRIDCVVKGDDYYDIYEIKTAENPFDCVTEALGQLCQYAYLFCRDKIGKMVIVGAAETTKEVEQYLSTLRKNHSLQLYYMKV